MGNELLLIVGYTIFSLLVTAAWVGGYLDPYQRKLQDLALNKMGDNRASYGIKSMQNLIMEPSLALINTRKLIIIQVPYQPPKQVTRTSTSCKATWVATSEVKLAKVVWERVSAAF